MAKDSFMLFSGSSHPRLAKEIADNLKMKVGNAQIDRFPDGEIGVQIVENVRGREVFVVQSIAREPNLYLMELLILIDALKRASAQRIIAVIPYYGYARQDRKERGRVPITAKLVADLLEKAGVHRVVTMDLHSEQIQGFFNIPVDNLYARPTLVEAVKRAGLEEPVVTAPDIGSIKLARVMATEMGATFAVVDKKRISSTEVESVALFGDVQNRDVILVDDICSTGGTLRRAALACKEAGARRIIAAVTHGLFLGEILQEKSIERFLVTNTIPLPDEIDHTRIDVCSVAGTFGKAMECIINNDSVSSLFRPAT
ncbi:MAG: Ribose-phosphate pyrophosphokinase [Chlamydiae bacterium]|nr:Ribose-phosphate pyrophosphokinase [Chlamydiota bacterium]